MKFNRVICLTLTSLLTVLNACNSDTPTAPVRAANNSPATYQEADRLRETLGYLASDQLEGRGLMTSGIDKAADFIAQNFKDAGLKPLPGVDGYFQSFQTTISTEIADGTNLRIADNSLKIKEDFTALGMSDEGSFDGPLAFVGYGISSDEYKYDDYAGIDVKGRVVLAMRYEPHDDDGDSRFEKKGWSDQAALSAKAEAAADHGATALILVNPANYHGQDRLMPFTRRGGERSSIPVMMITVDQADALLKSAASTNLKSAQASIDSTGKPKSFLLNDALVSGNVTIVRNETTIKNVVGYLPGKGPHAHEYIVVGAHYDHLGRGERGSMSPRGKEIHNGADDNASGTVALIEIARSMSKIERQRSIIFIAFSGEERGLLGSAHFVKHPPVPLENLIAMLNLDMIGRVRDDVIFVGGAGTAAEFDSIVEQADERSPLTAKTAGAKVGARGGIGPSDHESFALKKIPVLFLYSGMHMDYHRPTDDIEKINFLGIAQTVDFSADLVDQLTRMPRAEYVSSFDKSFGMMGGSNVQFGIMPDYNDDSTAGVRVAGTVPDTAAAKAGVKEGDVIVAFDDSKIASLDDYMAELSKHKPGDQIRVTILRNNQEVQLDATLTERRGG